MMEKYSFVFTVLFMLLGPIKAIGPFAAATREVDDRFQHAVAIRATLISAALLAFVVFSGSNLLDKYQISADALAIAGGLVLLLAALRTIFDTSPEQPKGKADASPMLVAVSPVASPIIVTPAGVAAILIFTMLAPKYAGMMHAVGVSLLVILVLNFLAMYFNRVIVSLAPLMLVLQLLGSVLVFMQVALAVDTMLIGFKGVGLL